MIGRIFETFFIPEKSQEQFVLVGVSWGNLCSTRYRFAFLFLRGMAEILYTSLLSNTWDVSLVCPIWKIILQKKARHTQDFRYFSYQNSEQIKSLNAMCIG